MMSLDDIAYELGTSKQNVSQILKRAMRKIYNNSKKVLDDCWNPLEGLYLCSLVCNINNNEKDLRAFYNDFPDDIQAEIKEYCEKNGVDLI